MPNADDAPEEQQSHYFSDSPAGTAQRQSLDVLIRGTEHDVVTAGGVFSGGRVDLGTRVLLREVPDPPETGDLLDLGCGWGPVTLALADASPRAKVWAVDVNSRALELTAENATTARATGVVTSLPDDVPDDVRFAAIWSNPPIRVGKEVLHELLLRWLPRLVPGGEAYLVVQRNLGADSLQTWLIGALGEGWSVERFGSAKGFRVLRVVSPA